jgi:hypothetical protein
MTAPTLARAVQRQPPNGFDCLFINWYYLSLIA